MTSSTSLSSASYHAGCPIFFDKRGRFIRDKSGGAQRTAIHFAYPAARTAADFCEAKRAFLVLLSLKQESGGHGISFAPSARRSEAAPCLQAAYMPPLDRGDQAAA